MVYIDIEAEESSIDQNHESITLALLIKRKEISKLKIFEIFPQLMQTVLIPVGK